MPARVVELAQGVADYIASQTYTYTFNVQRKMIVSSDLASTNTTEVYVFPQYDQGKQLPVDTRDKFGRSYTILVQIVNFVDDLNEQREVDDALYLAEQLEESLENIEIAGFAMLGFAAENSASFLEEGRLHERRTFHVIIPIIFITVD